MEHPFKSVLSSMIVIRDSVIHRRRLSTFKVATVIPPATKLINAFQDDRRAVQLSEIRKELLNQSKVLAITKASLQTKVADEIRVL